MFKNKKGKLRKPKSVQAYKSMSSSSVISELSNPSEHTSSEEEEDEVSIPDAIAEEESSEEGDEPPVNPRESTFDQFNPDFSQFEAEENMMSGNNSKKKKVKRTPKKPKKSSKNGGSADDDDSADDKSTKSGRSTKSARSTKRGGKKKKTKKKKKSNSVEDITESDDEEFLDEFEALQDEVISLRRKLNMKDDSMEMTQLQMDVKRALNEANELKSEIEEYEEAVAEKDGLIKKLTEAVDCQLDKVEYLELKLQRAEEEFVKMEDEMREMEDEIDEVRNNGGIVGGGGGGGAPRGEGGPFNEELNAELLERERDLEERENDLLMKEQELLDREKTLVDREEAIEIEEEKLSDQKDDLRMKELQFEEREREQLENNQITSGGLISTYELEEKQEEINTLKRNLALKTGEVHELRGQLSRGTGSSGANASVLREENDRLKVRLSNYESQEKELLQSRNEEIRNIQMGAEKQMQDLYDQNETLKRRVEALTLEQADIQHSDMHIQLKKKDEFALRQQKELEQAYQENYELKEDLADTSQKLKKAELQVREFKGSANKKTKQKDETIDFLQSEMVRLTMEKQQLDKVVQEKINEVETLHFKFANVGQDEEAEMLRIQAFTEQIRILDETNQGLQNKMKIMEEGYLKELQEKESSIQEMQNSKGGGYARSRIQLSQTQGELRQAQDRIQELEATIEDLRQQKDAGRGRRSQQTSYDRANGATSNGGLGVFGNKAKPADSAKPVKGRWGWGGRTEENESAYDLNNRNNMVPHKSPQTREKSVVATPKISAPIIAGQSIEDELAAIEADAKKYEDLKRSDSAHSGNFRVDMTGKLKSSDDSGSEEEDSSQSSASSSGSVGMNIAERLEAMRAKRNSTTTTRKKSSRRIKTPSKKRNSGSSNDSM
ncbi:unnamed protein product [Cylindrotheca closterium]|uniref:Uncharacterized protein n=1 Tax=Cylindrotheca closterium TaxID=2856 RepID=A0AAD2CQR7_9STRA|nr:unnamed protein product [Cylindrotheca closterium]